MIFNKRVVVWYHERARNERGEWYHTNMSLIKSYHTVTHVIIFLSYTTTPGIILYKYTLSLFNFTNYRLLELSNAKKQQCSVWRVVAKKIIKKILKKKIKKKKFKIKILNICSQFFSSKNSFHKIKKCQHFPPIKFSSYHIHRITLVVSHSSYHTRRITLVVSHSHATSGGIWRILVR